MKLVERTIIRKSHSLFKEIDHLSFLSKNLYNSTLFLLRKQYFKKQKLSTAYTLIKQFKNSNQSDYIALPRKVSAWIMFQVEQDFKNFFAALKSHAKDNSKFTDKPSPPYYKDKLTGRNLLTYEKQAIWKKDLKQQIIHLSGSNIKISTRKVNLQNIRQVKISKIINGYVISVIYEQELPKVKKNKNYASVDLGLNNLAAVTFSDLSQPQLINGKPLKSINHFYNKRKAEIQSQLMQEDPKRRSSNKLNQLTFKRNNKITDYMHKASRYLVNQLVSKNISILVIGYNSGWKQEINIGKKNNQNFVDIPHLKFIRMLQYKCALVGITVIIREESYTSKCSFLDLEKIQKHKKYKGKRVKRGMFKSSTGRKLNADINGSYNILRKAVPKVFNRKVINNGIQGVAVHPILVTI